MIRVVEQLCINSPSILEGELWEKTIFATASHIATFLVPRPPRRRQAFHIPHSTFPAPQALLNTYNLTLICSMPCGILWE